MASSGTEINVVYNYDYTLYWSITENYSNNTCTVTLSGNLRNNKGDKSTQGIDLGIFAYIPNGQYYTEFTRETYNVINSRFIYAQVYPDVFYVPGDGTVANIPQVTRTFDLNGDGTIDNLIVGFTWGSVLNTSDKSFDNSISQVRKTLSTKASNGHRNINGTWKNGYFWKKVNGTWKRCLIWKKISGTWKKGI